MSKAKNLFRRVSDKFHARVDDSEYRERLKSVIYRASALPEAQAVKEQLIDEAIKAAEKMNPAYDATKTASKAAGGLTEGSIAGAIAAVVASVVMTKMGVDDEQTKLLVTVSITSIISGATIGLKRLYFNWQKHRFNK